MNNIDFKFIYLESFIDNVKNFLQSLTVIDIIFFFAVVLLMILLVILLYFIKSNEDYQDDEKSVINFDTNENFDFSISNNNVSDERNIVKEPYNQFSNAQHNNYDDEEGELLDLQTITKALENKDVNTVDLTQFEEEQERDAIISYDELIKKSSPNTFSYKKETMIDDVSVKEIDLDSLCKTCDNKENTFVKSISYEEEEAFLEALKSLQKSLN